MIHFSTLLYFTLLYSTLPQVIQRPIELGADFVIQSTTKFYDGHNMTVGGAVVAATGLSP